MEIFQGAISEFQSPSDTPFGQTLSNLLSSPLSYEVIYLNSFSVSNLVFNSYNNLP